MKIKIESLKRIQEKLNQELALLENEPLLKMSEEEIQLLDMTTFNKYLDLSEKLRQNKQDLFVIEMLVIENKVIKE